MNSCTKHKVCQCQLVLVHLEKNIIFGKSVCIHYIQTLLRSCIQTRDGNGPGRPWARSGLKIQARGPHWPKRA